MDPATLATAALTAVTPYLLKFGSVAAKEAATGAGKSAWDWIKSKLGSAAGKEAVADLEGAPGERANFMAVEAALAKLLKNDPSAAEELAKLLDSHGVSVANQTVNNVGDNNKFGQASQGGSVTIS